MRKRGERCQRAERRKGEEEGKRNLSKREGRCWRMEERGGGREKESE